MKPEQAQKPSANLVRLGTQWSANNEALTIGPKEGRTEAICEVLDGCIATESCPPSQAGTLAGKSSYVTTTSFGKVGRAPLKALFSRQHDDTG